MYFLKYRPKSIEDLDSQEIRRQLAAILSRKEIPHALLFAGPKGSGKTSAARIFAKAINCQNQSVRPCNQCPFCLEIEKNTTLDILEIDAASNRGIDDIRLLKEKLGLAPARLKYRVYIIDEVHMLTKEAFNALLKVLEEPPPHVVFIFCTTDPEKIIPTVASRLIRVDFKKGRSVEILRSLKKVVEGEGLEIEKKVLDEIVKIADGSFRDAHKVLESLVLSCEGGLTWEKVKGQLGQWLLRQPEELLSLLAENKPEAAIKIGEELAGLGVDFGDYLKRLMELGHQILLFKMGVIPDLGINPRLLNLSVVKLKKLLKLLARANLETKNALLPQLPLQLAIIDFCSLGGGSRGSIILQKEKERKEATPIIEENERKEVEKNLDLGSGKENQRKKGKTLLSEEISLEKVLEIWPKLLEIVKPMNHSVSAFLKAATPGRIEGKTIFLEVFYQFHRDKLSEERNRRIVEEGFLKLGCPLKVECVLSKKGASLKKALSIKDKPDGDDLYRIAQEIFGN